MSETEPMSDVAALAVQLLSAYLANNTVASEDLADLIRTTRAALTEDAAPAEQVEAETFTPAVSVRKSLASSEHIISLIDGKPYKTLKRHLASHGLTPDTYRSRYNLPAGYPMVAPDYAAHRRAVAQKIGLGSRKPAAQSEDQMDLDSATQDAPGSDMPEAEQPTTAETPVKSAGRGSKTSRKSASRAKSSDAQASETTSDAASASPQDTDVQPDTGDTPAKPKSRARKGKEPAKATQASEAATATTKRRTRKDAAEPTSEQATGEAADAPETGGEEKAAGKSAPKKASSRTKKPRMARAPETDGAANDGATD